MDTNDNGDYNGQTSFQLKQHHCTKMLVVIKTFKAERESRRVIKSITSMVLIYMCYFGMPP